MKKGITFIKATAVFTIIIGALAFKNHKSNPNIWYCNKELDQCLLTPYNRTQNVGHGTFIIPNGDYYAMGFPGQCVGNCEIENINPGTVVYINE